MSELLENPDFWYWLYGVLCGFMGGIALIGWLDNKK